MNQRTRFFIRYLFVVLFGVFLHFAYELSGNNPIVGLFAPVNESVWEHLKLLFFPMLSLTIWDLFTTNRSNLNFLPPRTIAILSGLAFIVVFYYTITGIVGMDIAWINIVIYPLIYRIYNCTASTRNIYSYGGINLMSQNKKGVADQHLFT